MVKVMGMLTLETVPGLNRHCRNALVAALSRIEFPVLDETLHPLTLPLPDSTVQTITPLPVTCRERASSKGIVDVARIQRGLSLSTSTSGPDSSLARILSVLWLPRRRCSFFDELRLNLRRRRRLWNRDVFRRRSRFRRS